jgi:Leucine-rich repeat (LRR) protein
VSVNRILANVSALGLCVIMLLAMAPPVMAAPIVVSFPDPNLQAAIRQAINKPTGDIYQSDLANLTTLTADDQGISNLEGLEYCTSLQALVLKSNQISDISALTNLTKLQNLHLEDNQISDISPLKNLTNLITLDLEDNQISDISPLKNLTNLLTLYLNDNQISDISPLKNLTSLTWLDLNDNQISDISALNNLTKLQFLYVAGGNQISDISALKNLTSLTWLNLDFNQISDISALKNLTSLTWLYLDFNQISDISALKNLTDLTKIYLDNNQISDITALVAIQGIGTGDILDLRNNYLNVSSGSKNMSDIQTLIDRGVNLTYLPQNAPSVLTSLGPNYGVQGQTLTGVIINGTNLTGVTSINFSGTGVKANNLIVNSTGTQITANIMMDSNATTGARDVSVTTPVGTSAALVGAFTVLASSSSNNSGISANTSVAVQSGSGSSPLVKAMWESTDNSPNSESGDPGHSSYADPLLTQVAPNAGFQAKTPVNFWAVVTDPAGIGNLGNIYADVYYPASGADPGPSNSLKFEVQLTQIIPNGPNSTALADFNAAYAAQMVEVNANTPTFAYPIGSSATQVGDIQEEIIQGTANLYEGTYYFDNCELTGNYPVVVNAVNLQNVHGTLTNTLQWLPLTSAAFDFTSVNYGSVAVGVDKQINGDYTWNTPNTGANPATIENTGNTYLQMTVSQDDMGLGSNLVNGVTTWNVFYDARMGDGTLGGFPNNGILTYQPNVTTTLPQILKLCALDKIDFSITVVKDPSTGTNHSYSGTMTLGAVYSAGPALEGTEYMIGTPAPTTSP